MWAAVFSEVSPYRAVCEPRCSVKCRRIALFVPEIRTALFSDHIASTLTGLWHKKLFPQLRVPHASSRAGPQLCRRSLLWISWHDVLLRWFVLSRSSVFLNLIQFASSCNDPLGFINFAEFLDQLSDYQRVNKCSMQLFIQTWGWQPSGIFRRLIS
jgi:hypothetical protein